MQNRGMFGVVMVTEFCYFQRTYGDLPKLGSVSKLGVFQWPFWMCLTLYKWTKLFYRDVRGKQLTRKQLTTHRRLSLNIVQHIVLVGELHYYDLHNLKYSSRTLGLMFLGDEPKDTLRKLRARSCSRLERTNCEACEMPMCHVSQSISLQLCCNNIIAP